MDLGRFLDPFHVCLKDVCHAISWSGVPDILGPGVCQKPLLPIVR